VAGDRCVSSTWTAFLISFLINSQRLAKEASIATTVMLRLQAALVTFVLLISCTSAIDWTFWSDEDESETGSDSTSLSSAEDDSSSMNTAVQTETSYTTAPTTSGSASLFSSATSASQSATMDYTLAKVTDAESTVTSTHRNWVGPWTAADSACYREAHIMDTCPTNFDRDDALGTCWTECPIAYPVECGMECIRQNDDCTLEIVNKVGSVASTALTIATLGASKELWAIAKGVKTAVNCANSMIGTVRAIIRYVRNIKTSDPQTSQDKILALLYQTNNVVTDLPMAIYACMGVDTPTSLSISGRVLTTFEWILTNVIAYDDEIVSSWDRFKAFLTGANFSEAANAINDTEIATLSDALASNSTCGFDLKSLTDRTWMTVAQLKADNPDITEDELRLEMEDSQLVTTDVGVVTNNCMEQLIAESDEATAYDTRDKIRTAGRPRPHASSRTRRLTRASPRSLSRDSTSRASRECWPSTCKRSAARRALSARSTMEPTTPRWGSAPSKTPSTAARARGPE